MIPMTTQKEQLSAKLPTLPERYYWTIDTAYGFPIGSIVLSIVRRANGTSVTSRILEKLNEQDEVDIPDIILAACYQMHVLVDDDWRVTKYIGSYM